MSKTANNYSPKVHKRAVRMVLRNQNKHRTRTCAILPILSKIGRTPQALNEQAKKVEVDTGRRGGITTEMAEKMKALEHESCEPN